MHIHANLKTTSYSHYFTNTIRGCDEAIQIVSNERTMDWRRKTFIKTQEEGSFWKKIFNKALRLNDSKGRNERRSPSPKKDIVYLNLYLTSLEKKLVAIEEATRLKYERGDCGVKGKAMRSKELNVRKQLSNHINPDARCALTSSVNSETDSQNVTVLRDYDPDAIVKEILFGYPENSPLFSRPTMSEENVYKTHQNKNFIPKYLPGKKHYASTYSQPIECHRAVIVGIPLEVTTAHWKATCSVNYLDSSVKMLEIVYNNNEWNKRGTIVLKDLENQANSHELMGRVICFLLGLQDDEELS